MPETYLPAAEAQLYQWATTFEAFLQATPTAVGISAPQATAFASLYANFANAYRAAVDPATRGPATIQTKNDAKAAMIDGPGGIRDLVKIIQAFPDTTNTQRVQLGIVVADEEPTPVPPPAFPPLLGVLSTSGRTVKLTVRDINNSEGRAKPEGVAGATVLMYVGETAPVDPAQWIFCMNTTRTTVVIDFPPAFAPGAKVWLTAFWKNRREEAGPAAAPVSTRLGDTLAMAA